MKSRIFLLLGGIFIVVPAILKGADLADLTYAINYEEVSITDCKTTAVGNLEIPSEIEGLPVTSIGNAAFRSCAKLTAISIPEGVKTIGDESFYSCSQLAEVSMPNTVEFIGNSAFRYCGALASIQLPQSITSIGESVFHNCTSLNQIAIPDTVTNIGERAFRDCKNLSTVVIPESVTNIERLAFYGCTKLRQIHIDGQLPSFGSNVFGGSANSYITHSGDLSRVAGRPSFNPVQLFEVQDLKQTIQSKDSQIAQLSLRPSVQEIQDARAGSIMMARDPLTGKATLKFEIEQTQDFQSWRSYEGGELSVADEGGFELLLPLDADKKWLRVAMNGDSPDTFPSLGDGGVNIGDFLGGNGGGIPGGGGFPGIDLNNSDKELDFFACTPMAP